MDVLQWLVCLQVSDLNNKRMWTERLSIDDELGHYTGMVCCTAQRTNPPLASSQVRRMKSECFVVRVPGGCGLQATHIRTVSQFCLSVAADDLVGFCRLAEQLVLLWGALLTNSDLQLLVQLQKETKVKPLQRERHKEANSLTKRDC